MLLSDLGADVVRIDRKGPGQGGARSSPADVIARGRRSVALDLKHPEAIETCLKLLEGADGLIEGFRPGVMERLGLGPRRGAGPQSQAGLRPHDGLGPDGALRQAAGHDMNYIAITGAPGGHRRRTRPLPPLNLVGDFGGGALYLAFGLLAGVIHARETGARPGDRLRRATARPR
ncbi:CoA transferase [Caulobacter segnis]